MHTYWIIHEMGHLTYQALNWYLPFCLCSGWCWCWLVMLFLLHFLIRGYFNNCRATETGLNSTATSWDKRLNGARQRPPVCKVENRSNKPFTETLTFLSCWKNNLFLQVAPPRKPWNKQDQWFHQPCKVDVRYKLDCRFYSDDFHEVAVHFMPCRTNWGRDTASHRRRRKSQFGEALRCIDNHLQSRRSPLNLNYIKLWGVRRFPPPRTIIQRIFDEEVHSFFFSLSRSNTTSRNNCSPSPL